MTSKLKCPVCNHDLFQTAEPLQYCCMNKDCPSGFTLAGTPQLWTALTQAKQDLVIAKSYVKGISQMVINPGDNIYIVIGHFKKLAEQTLEQIEHKE